MKTNDFSFKCIIGILFCFAQKTLTEHKTNIDVENIIMRKNCIKKILIYKLNIKCSPLNLIVWGGGKTGHVS